MHFQSKGAEAWLFANHGIFQRFQGGSLHGESVLAPSLHRGHSSSVLIGLGQLLGVRLSLSLASHLVCGMQRCARP